MKQHDPYRLLLDELKASNDIDTDEELRIRLRNTQPYVRALREGYKQSPCHIDYSCRHNRAAYLLTYYPHYIEILYHILSNLRACADFPCFEQSKARACFLGAGPAPEVLGWLMYLNEYESEPTQAVAYLLDKYNDGWRKGQEMTRYHLAPVYWPTGKLVTVPVEFDLLNCATSVDELDPFVAQSLVTSDLFVMQNCLNDQLEQSDTLIENFLWLFGQTPDQSIFVLADLMFCDVQALMLRIEKAVSDSGLGYVFVSAKDAPADFRSSIILPDVVREELLTGEDGLIPKKHTKVYRSVLIRTPDNKDVDILSISF